MTGFLWMRTVFSSELKKMLSYRVDFWVQFPAMVLIQIGLAFFLWDSIFELQNITKMNGYSFSGLMLYYLMVPLVDRILRGVDMRFISSEIYEGTLSRYLIYPVSFFLFKYLQHLAQFFISFLQFILTILLFVMIFGIPDEFQASPQTVIMGTFLLFTASIMYFIFASIFECVAFWADNVWSLLVMLRLTIFFLGGGMIPLNFFPEWSVDFLNYTPFPYMAYFPIRAYFGLIPFDEFLKGAGIIFFWILSLALLLRILWKKGLLSYTGVGM